MLITTTVDLIVLGDVISGTFTIASVVDGKQVNYQVQVKYRDSEQVEYLFDRTADEMLINLMKEQINDAAQSWLWGPSARVVQAVTEGPADIVIRGCQVIYAKSQNVQAESPLYHLLLEER